MSSFTKSLVCLTFSAMLTGTLSAKENQLGTYIGLGYDSVELQVGSKRSNDSAVNVRAGMHLTQKVGVEARYGLASSSKDYSLATETLKNYSNISVLMTHSFGFGFTGIGKLGMTRIELNKAATQSGTSFGLALRKRVGNFALEGEYEQLFKKEGLVANSVGLNGIYNF